LQTKIRVGAVSYLNTKPLIFGLEHGIMAESVDLKIEFPAKIASMLLKDQIDVGLVPVAVIPEMKEHYIISDYCIGCDGAVASVCLFSEVPLDKIEKVLLDYQSRTSVELLKILIKHYWKINPVFEQTSGEYQSKISGTTAALVIGDRALEQRKISRYIYDLGLEWKKFTGLPFVFAAWVSNKKLNTDFIDSFNKATAFGLGKIDKIVMANSYPIFNLKDYYTKYISYRLDERKQEGLKIFMEKIETEHLSRNNMLSL
jgi:chorismate dehydratase